MSMSKLATALSVLFVVSVVALAGELIYVLWRHRSFRRRSSPIRSHHESPSPITDLAATKELQLYFFYLKPDTPPHNHNDDDHVVDVFKLLDAKHKEDDEVEVNDEVDFYNESMTKTSSEVVVAVMFDHHEEEGNTTKTVFSTPCDSPMFFTPVGSPSRD